ncbi:MAG: hypothetical protein GYA35_04210 [Thermoanaerobaculaceae bacterium]|nr:hypothetical protein [Thermoanaerobaculaceae bacterium]
MEIKISFSKEQFEKAVKLVYIGNLVVNGMREGDDDNPRFEEYDEIENIFLKTAHENGFKHFVEKDEDEDEYYPSEELEFDKEIDLLMDDYVEDCFWEELALRLASRDVAEKVVANNDLSFPSEKDFKLLEKIIDEYNEEFEDNGIDNLRIVKKPE